MKLVLEFVTDKNIFPIEYRRTCIHFLKECLNNANDGKYYEDYYGGTNTKSFTFAVFFDKPSFGENCIELSSNRVKMLFSTSDKLTGLIFYSSFIEKKNKNIMLSNDNSMKLQYITKVAEPTIKSDKILVKMNSPLIIRNHNRELNKDYYYAYDQEAFEKEAIRTIRHQLENQGFGDKFLEGLKITPIKCKKVIVKHYRCKIEGSLGNFLIEGHPAILNYLLQSGIGSRKSEGFGMFELLTDEV